MKKKKDYKCSIIYSKNDEKYYNWFSTAAVLDRDNAELIPLFSETFSINEDNVETNFSKKDLEKTDLFIYLLNKNSFFKKYNKQLSQILDKSIIKSDKGLLIIDLPDIEGSSQNILNKNKKSILLNPFLKLSKTSNSMEELSKKQPYLEEYFIHLLDKKPSKIAVIKWSEIANNDDVFANLVNELSD